MAMIPIEIDPEFAGQPPVDFILEVLVERDVSEADRRALEHLVRKWFEAGASGAFSPPGPRYPLNYLGNPEWSGQSARWGVDRGGSDLESALHDLARRLADWSANGGSGVRLRVVP